MINIVTNGLNATLIWDKPRKMYNELNTGCVHGTVWRLLPHNNQRPLSYVFILSEVCNTSVNMYVLTRHYVRQYIHDNETALHIPNYNNAKLALSVAICGGCKYLIHDMLELTRHYH